MLATILLCLAPAPVAQGPENPFVVRHAVADTFGARRIFVSADKRSIDCFSAMQQLTAAVGWNLLVDNQPLEADLRFHRVDLNFADQEARMVAQLIAVAAGADVVFDEAEPVEGARSTVHVLRTPDADTESGRQRLRAMAGQWYRSFLQDELQHDPLVAREAVQVRMSLGQLLVDSGDLDGAISFFKEAYDQRPNEQAAAAILRITECHLDLGKAESDRVKRMNEYQQAEEWVRRLFENMPSAPEITPATILLGRAILGQAGAERTPEAARKHAERCQTELFARVIRLVDSVEMLDVWLLVGESQLLLERPDRVYETMLTLRESPNFGDLRDDQFLGYHFLLGYGALGTDKAELAMRSFEWYLIHAENDARRGQAYVLLAESYLALNRFVQARAAAVEARSRFLGELSDAWRQRALKVWARTALALGEKDLAFLELEQIIARGQDPELAIFVITEMIADRQWQRAIAVADRLTNTEGRIGDQARFEKIRALYEQAIASKHLEDFPEQAVSIAPRIEDPQLRRDVATMIGDAYSKLGKLEHAADAYRGILR
ncbi:MAG: hypothetical protein H6838_01715 [Planctomycetes bacterium]|nr:hypothetical protein [Planctomycetota bacterium]MCB9884175.1 hypothetical protein [Planctomycetota bacterium]